MNPRTARFNCAAISAAISLGTASGLLSCSTGSRSRPAPQPTTVISAQAPTTHETLQHIREMTNANANANANAKVPVSSPYTGTDAGEACVGPGAEPERPHATNIFGAALSACPSKHRTGFHRNGYCNTGPTDHGRHVVCARVTDAFLKFSRSQGNDLTRASESFPGLVPGDTWCLCAARFREALGAGVAPQVYADATDVSALEFIERSALVAHSQALPAAIGTSPSD